MLQLWMRAFGAMLLTPPLLWLGVANGGLASGLGAALANLSHSAGSAPVAPISAPVSAARHHHSDGPHATVPLPKPMAAGHQTQQVQAGPARHSAVGLDHLTPLLTNVLAAAGGSGGVSVIDLTTGETLAIHAKSSFPAASTFKLPMAMYILQQVDQGKAQLDDQLTLLSEDWEDGTGVMQGDAPGSTYRVDHLLELAIEESDNIATNMLLRHFGRQNVWAFEQRVGGAAIHDGSDVNITTPADLTLYLRQALGPKVLTAASRTRLLQMLEHTDFPIRIAAGVPKGVPVGHKIGTLPGVVNDVGLVALPGHPYALAVCTADLSEDAANDLIASISHTVYQFYTTVAAADKRLGNT